MGEVSEVLPIGGDDSPPHGVVVVLLSLLAGRGAGLQSAVRARGSRQGRGRVAGGRREVRSASSSSSSSSCSRDTTVVIQYLGSAAPGPLPACLPPTGGGVHQFPAPSVDPLQLLLSLFDLLVVAPDLPLSPLLRPATPLAGPGPSLVVPGRQSWLGLLLVISVHNIDVGVYQVERGGGPWTCCQNL